VKKPPERLERQRDPPYETGRPLIVDMANDMGGFLFNNHKRPNFVGGDPVAAEGDFDPNTNRYFNRDAWADPGPLTFGNSPRTQGSVRGFAVYNEDLNISKAFELSDRARMRFEVMAGNIFNRTTFCNPNSNWSSGAFGRSSRSAIRRSIQLGVRLDY
jgi:hypothetical protein